MRKYRQFIIGVIVGAMFSVVPISAAIEEYILYKADYKVMINGKEYISEEHPILNYQGTTYGPLRPMLEAAGLNVEWNIELSQAEVTTPIATSPEVQSLSGSEVMTLAETPTKITQTPDGITQIDTWEGKQYIGWLYIRNKIREKGYDLVNNIPTGKWMLIKGNYNIDVKGGYEIIIDDLPVTMLNGYGYGGLEVNYYINTILPLIK